MSAKWFIATLMFFLQIGLSGQDVLELYPALGELIELSEQGEQEFYALEKQCKALWEKMGQGFTEDEVRKENQALYDTCLIDRTDYWAADEIGCSWYCGGGPYQVSASSSLGDQGDKNYDGANAHDLSYKTAWVEGVEGHGIGEFLTYEFTPLSPRITKVIVVNGYVRNEKVWKENSRVKTLDVLLDGELMAVLHLEDSKAKQYFDVGEIGHSDRKDLEKLEAMPPWILTFEIREVYPGERYEDTVITEVFFDGIDVH